MTTPTMTAYQAALAKYLAEMGVKPTTAQQVAAAEGGQAPAGGGMDSSALTTAAAKYVAKKYLLGGAAAGGTELAATPAANAAWNAAAMEAAGSAGTSGLASSAGANAAWNAGAESAAGASAAQTGASTATTTGTLSAIAPYLGGAAALYGGYNLANNYGQGGAKGRKQGAIDGATTGAGIGTMILPGVGTAIGAGIGALGGLALGSVKVGKHNDQIKRDTYRAFLEKQGVTNKYKTADGYDMGRDGGARLQNVGTNIDGKTERGTYDVDFSNPLAKAAVSYINPLTAAQLGQEGKIQNDATGLWVNKVLEGAKTEDDVRKNALAVYMQNKLGKSDAQALLAGNKEGIGANYNIYAHDINKLFGGAPASIPARNTGSAPVSSGVLDFIQKRSSTKSAGIRRDGSRINYGGKK